VSVHDPVIHPRKGAHAGPPLQSSGYSPSFPGSCQGMPVLRALPGLGGTGILPVIDRRDACPTNAANARPYLRKRLIMGSLEIDPSLFGFLSPKRNLIDILYVGSYGCDSRNSVRVCCEILSDHRGYVSEPNQDTLRHERNAGTTGIISPAAEPARKSSEGADRPSFQATDRDGSLPWKC